MALGMEEGQCVLPPAAGNAIPERGRGRGLFWFGIGKEKGIQRGLTRRLARIEWPLIDFQGRPGLAWGRGLSEGTKVGWLVVEREWISWSVSPFPTSAADFIEPMTGNDAGRSCSVLDVDQQNSR